ncbi:MAG: hypothetical protein MJ247_03240 [Alphaproteobacteria bacterium]|nr:hypothetical protein [Alphaproteobacteria bacterium]
MALDEDDKLVIKAVVEPIIDTVGIELLTAAVNAGIKKLSATNVEESDLSGKRDLKPSEQEVTISKTETAASETEGKLSKDGVSAQHGDIEASETTAVAQGAEATALESGAQAVRTKAGASDIEAKALKIT